MVSVLAGVSEPVSCLWRDTDTVYVSVPLHHPTPPCNPQLKDHSASSGAVDELPFC